MALSNGRDHFGLAQAITTTLASSQWISIGPEVTNVQLAASNTL